MSSLALLEEMSTYSTEMVDAARANDWDRLTHLEKKVASLRDRMGMEEALGFQGRGTRRMSEEERLKKVALIRRILDDDKEVRVHTEPWMDSVRQLLSGGTRQRKLRDTYGGNDSDV
jgi:flagellar protein FliT